MWESIRKRKYVVLLTAFFSVITANTTACDKKRDSGGAQKKATKEKKASSTNVREAQSASRNVEKQDVHDDHHDEHHTGSNSPVVKLPPDGHLGAPLTIKENTSLKKIFTKPQAFLGKKIRVAGKVMAQCVKRRRWFAIADKGKRPWLYISTEPKFFIHPTAIGMQAIAEGVLQEREIPVKAAKHFAKTHKLFGGKPKAITGPQKQLFLKATGAKFSQ
jgi:hypothetical protein